MTGSGDVRISRPRRSGNRVVAAVDGVDVSFESADLELAVSTEAFASAFLLAAIVLGGMGTVAGVLVGATILKLLPEKLRFIADYRLLIFGLVLVLMMRVRPEGLIANKRRKLEFHEEDEELAKRIEAVHLEETEVRA